MQSDRARPTRGRRSGVASGSASAVVGSGSRTELAAAIREAYTGRFTQSQLAERIGVAQNSVSRWATGDVEPCLDDIAAIEVACDLPRGHVLRRAGFVAEHDDVESVLSSDHRLDPARRELLIAAYRVAVELSTGTP